ncbi:hypothetical protein CW705_04725 [Candidatus Bathyarchaeota archaeon]|nr:MAG: hypothetical protein CW705_04725 [Candidatus Bathyarchaeota archaeon]
MRKSIEDGRSKRSNVLGYRGRTEYTSIQEATFFQLIKKYRDRIEKVHKKSKKYVRLLVFGGIIFSSRLISC